MTRRPAARWGLAAAGLVVVWLAGEWVGPRLVASAYRGESLEVFNRIIDGREAHDLEFYQDAWRALWRWGLVALAVSGVLLSLAVRDRARLAAAARDAVRSGPAVRPVVALWIAAWFGALSGIAQGAHLSMRHLFERHPRGFSWDLAWMGPLSSTAAFLALAAATLGLFALMNRHTGRRIRLRPLVFILAFVACYGLLEASEFRLAGYAVVLLCAGLAAVIARAAGARERGFRRVLVVSTPAVAGILVAAGLAGLLNRPAMTERRALADLPLVEGDSPNVLLIILDTARAQSFGLYGHDRATSPVLRAWADSGVVFERAIATAPWTLTSHASMFTGRLPHELSADFRVPLGDAHPTLAEAMRERGYATAGFVANLGYASKLSGLGRGFARYEDFPLAPGRFFTTSWLPRWLANDVLSLDTKRWPGAETPREFGKKSGERVTGSFLDWVAELEGRPFFAFLNYMDTHTPYIPPEPYDSMFVEPGMDLSPVARHPGNSAEEMRGQEALYDGAVAYLDREIGRLLDGLSAAGVLENTLVIVTSDHGEQFGEHGLIGHGDSLYWPVLHVPLVMVFGDRVPRGARVHEPVSLRDLPATILDLIDPESASPFPGRSLARFWNGTASPPGPVFSQVNVVPIARPWEPSFAGPMASLILGDHHLIRDGAGEIELFDIIRDPEERTDLSGRADVAKIRARLEGTLDSILALGRETDGRP